MHLAGQRVKVSKEISVGDILQIRQGWDEKVIQVKALSTSAAARPKHKHCMQKPQTVWRNARPKQRRAKPPAA